MMAVKHKYVRHSTIGFVLWPDTVDLFHVEVAHAIERRSMGLGHVVSAGFAYIGPLTIVCNGESESLGIKSAPEDSHALARQLGRVTTGDHTPPIAATAPPQRQEAST